MQILTRSEAHKEKGEFYNIWANIPGIKKRCRKSQKHSVKIGYVGLSEIEQGKAPAEVIAKAREAVKASLKTYAPVMVLNFSKVEMTDDFEKGLMFDDANFTELVTVEPDGEEKK